MKQTQCTVQDPDVSGVLIDVAKHLGNLKFQVWQTMTGMVKHTPVILDPNTAGPFLIFSKDLTSVTSSEARFTCADPNTLFGSQGFSSGKHQWDVEFHEHTFIDIGIAEECQKQRWSKDERHVCTVRYCGGCHVIEEKSVLRGMLKIRVLLDCNEKTLSFFDVYGNKTFANGKRYTLTGKLFPLFYFYEVIDDLNLKILPAKIKVMQKVQ
ncbi:E3 ubiquitin-protein ligase TRIM35-like [Conger conger]|uniref:E3 ubiquitin-protein ligase TRIM35-like n=1 Tax=Conger conger TaxID=82655 RepID=UPI002A5A3113|nr:E3 ubiquitin-protein ligase TRIM35-like [Conger conger]XP_061085357.1 E3 ubiquitin-protein ligase TRIM35-like [Conger conger]